MQADPQKNPPKRRFGARLGCVPAAQEVERGRGGPAGRRQRADLVRLGAGPQVPLDALPKMAKALGCRVRPLLPDE